MKYVEEDQTVYEIDLECADIRNVRWANERVFTNVIHDYSPIDMIFSL